MTSSRNQRITTCYACFKKHLSNQAIQTLSIIIQNMIGTEVSLEDAFLAGNAAPYYRQSVNGTIDLINSKFIYRKLI
jgi:hypothetical protein